MVKRIQPGTEVPLHLTDLERLLVVEKTLAMPAELESKVRLAVVKRGRAVVSLTLDDLEELHGHVAAEANHARSARLQAALDRVLRKIEGVMETYSDGQ